MGTFRQAKIAGQQLRASMGGKVNKVQYAKLVSSEAKEQAMKSAKKARRHRALGKASLKFKNFFK